MNLRTVVALLVAGSTFMAPAVFASEAGFSSGQWEFTRTVTGGPRNVPPQTAMLCITPDQIAQDDAAPITLGAVRSGEGPECTISDAARSQEGDASARMVCDGRMGKMRTELSGPASATSFDMSGKLKVAFFTANVRYQGRRLGDCPAS